MQNNKPKLNRNGREVKNARRRNLKKKEMQRATGSHYDAFSFTLERRHGNTRNLEKL